MGDNVCSVHCFILRNVCCLSLFCLFALDRSILLSAVVAALSIRLGIMGEGGGGGSGIALSEEAAPFLGKPVLPLKPPILSKICKSHVGKEAIGDRKKSPSVLLLS